ncbi:uncharacterized protein LOC133196830 [Saccostrea echinata]|uniref:uncharacterized protein LOC133196830 n=1 Tax=Saccostrea echinata TaxID=191078 RepID=UPI002A82D2E4|nr:uncharacterized protein LOC133196830 [Saccostrea echinata]
MKENDDLFPFVDDYANALSYVITILQMKGCAIGQSENCTISPLSFETILKKAEDNLIRITNLWLETNDGRGQQRTIDKRDILSLTVLKDKGKYLPFDFTTKYGYLKLPYFETFQDSLGDKIVAINVLTYIKSPYNYVNNTEATSSSIVKPVVTDKKGKRLNLNDLDDPVDMAVDMSQVFTATHTWLEPEILTDGSSMAVAFVNETNEAFSVEFKIKSFLECQINGIFGYTGLPTYLKRNIAVTTKGVKKVLKKTPDDLPVFFKDSVLQITVYNTKYPTDGYLDPLVLTLSCQDDVARRKRRDLTDYIGHYYRVQILSVVNLAGVLWKKSTASKIVKAEGDISVFRSTFFGTFGSDALISLPTPINFQEIFLNFLEKLESTPQVLAAEVFLIIFFIVIVIPLRKADHNDMLLWEYLPVLDNQPDDKFQYCLSIFTAIKSSRHLTSTVYLKLTGENGSTSERIIKTNCREDFRSGTCCNFLLTTEEHIGKLESLTVWHDNKGKSPDWKLSKVVVIDLYTGDRFVFLCGEWLSLKYDDVKTFRKLVPLTPEIINGEVVFTELSLRGFFDDHLWISLSKRPNYSRFSRVQRLWSLVALLFLSMVASAMWYNAEPTEEEQLASGNVQQSVKLGPFRFNLKQIYVGLMSSLITVIPSVIIISLFRKRNLKSESKTTRKENVVFKEKERSQCRMPWWTIFFAYFIIISAIAAGGFFTFLYSLQFGSEKTNDWLLSFVFGTFEGAFMMEPLKVLLLASLLGLCCKSSTDAFLECAGENHVHKVSYVDAKYRQDLIYFPCPNTDPDVEKLSKQRKLVQLDKKLKTFGISWIKSILYILLLAIVCSHNTITEAFRQNEYMKGSVKDTFLANTTDDIYVWMQTYFIPNVWPKWYGNQALRSAYEQRFMYDQYSYRISHSILRQVRSGNCSTIEEMTSAAPRCIDDFKTEEEDRTFYCKGWLPSIYVNETCYDEYDPIDNSFVYRTAEELKSMMYIGDFGVYGGGGYKIDLGPKQSLVNHYINQLRNFSWIDGYTRAVFIETNTFNANTRLFTHLKIVFELSEYGSIYMKTTAKSLNLYPYVTSMDYIVLACQFIFMIVVIVRLVFFTIRVFKTRHTCMTTFSSWVTAIDILMCLNAIVFYILRVDSTIKTVDDIIENKGSYVSFEYVQIYDLLYKTAFGIVFFFGVLELLQPLTMNYHFFILQKSLLRARYDLFMSIFLISLAIVSFGAYFYLSFGRYADNFKDLYSSIITLLRMLLAMISFRLNPSLNSAEGKVFTSLFFFTISIIGINLFIAILFSHFAYVQALQKKLNTQEHDKKKEKIEDTFDFELNAHVWRQLDRITHIFLERKVHAESLPQSFPDEVLKKLDILDQHVKLKCQDEYWFMKLLACMLYLTKTLRWNMYMAMDVTADYSKTMRMRYKFFYPFFKNPRLTIYFPDASISHAPEIQCSSLAHRYYPLPSQTKELLCSAKTRIYELKIHDNRPFQMKVNDITKRETILEFEDDFITDKDYLICSFDDRQSWHRYALRPRDEKLSCFLPKLPTHCFVTGRQGHTIVNEQSLFYFPDIEIHQIRRESCSIYMKADKRIRISFPPGCVDDDCDLYLMMDLPEKQICPFIHVYITKAAGCPVEISLPIVNQGLKNTENLIIIREGDGEWMTLNSVLKLDAAGYTFETSIIKSNVPTVFGIKEAELPWVENGFDQLDSKLIKAINMVSRYNSVAAKWKDIARSLDIEIPPVFNDKETDSYEIVNLREYSENQSTEERKFILNRITDIPISAQEKCLYIMAEWYRLFPRGLVVSSLKKVLEDCNLHYIAEQLYQRL